MVGNATLLSGSMSNRILEMSLYQILQIFSITLLEKMPISCVLEAFDSRSELLDKSKQLTLPQLSGTPSGRLFGQTRLSARSAT